MAHNNPIQLFPGIVALILTSTLAVASTSPAPEAAGGCSDEMVAFSPCLPYISSPPNNASFSPSAQCCDVFSSDFNSTDANCLCYLVKQPLLLGFPINLTRLFSLSSICPVSDTNGSLESLCSGSLTLPPLQAITGPRISRPRGSGPHNSPTPLPSPLPDPLDSPPATPSLPKIPSSAAKPSSPAKPNSSETSPISSLIPAIYSSAAKQINNCGDWFSVGIVCFLVTIFTKLSN